MKINKNSQYYKDHAVHVKKRIARRFGIEKDIDIVMDTLKGAVLNNGSFLKKANKGRKVYRVKTFKKEMKVVYCHRWNIPITVFN